MENLPDAAVLVDGDAAAATAAQVPPKRPQSAYFLFAASVRDQVKGKGASRARHGPSPTARPLTSPTFLPRTLPCPAVSDQAKIIGERWKALPAEARAPFEARAAEQKAAFAAYAASAEAQRASGGDEVSTPAVRGGRGGGGGGGGASGSERDDGVALQLPLSRVKGIVRLDREVGNVSADAAFLIATATELFVQLLAGECAAEAEDAGRRTLGEADVAAAVARVPALALLRYDFPKKTREQAEAEKRERAEARAARKAAAAESAGEGEEGAEGGEEGEDGEGAEGEEGEGEGGEREGGAGAGAPAKRQLSMVEMLAKGRELAAANPRRAGRRDSDSEDEDVVLVDGENAPASSSARAGAGAGARAGGKKGAAAKKPAGLDRFLVSHKSKEEALASWDKSFRATELAEGGAGGGEEGGESDADVRAARARRAAEKKARAERRRAGAGVEDEEDEAAARDAERRDAAEEDVIDIAFLRGKAPARRRAGKAKAKKGKGKAKKLEDDDEVEDEIDDEEES